VELHEQILSSFHVDFFEELGCLVCPGDDSESIDSADVPEAFGIIVVKNVTLVNVTDDCLLKFEPGETPKYLYARFSKLETCPPPAPTAPNDRVFKLTQDPELPCCWEYFSDEWYVSFEYLQDPDLSRLFIIHQITMQWYFFDAVDGHVDEGYVFHNDNTECFWDIGGIDGLGVITWTHQATELLEKINMERAQDLFMELHPLEDGKLVYKFCRLQDATNIAILFEP